VISSSRGEEGKRGRGEEGKRDKSKITTLLKCNKEPAAGY
jgi:hypothetical protein